MGERSNNVEMAPLASSEALLSNVEKENFEGIDDGLLPSTPRRPSTENGLGPRSSPIPPSYPEIYVPTNKPPGRKPMDVNLYATKKTVAQGMMDLALLTANANQLRYVLESGNTGPYFYFSVSLISLSIILQLVIGVALIFLGRYNMQLPDKAYLANRLNNWVVLGVFLITSVNVFVSAFGIEPVEPLDPALIVDATLDSMDKAKLRCPTFTEPL